MQEQIDNLTAKVQDLTRQLGDIQKILDTKGMNLEEFIRDAVFFDVDNKTTTSVSIGSGGGTAGAIPTKFIRGYFRGKAYNFAVYAIT